jgi:hypothetical protein
VRPLGPFREADDVTRAELVLALRVAERRSAGDDEQPFLVAVLVVVRERPLARLDLVEARAELDAADPLSDRRAPP